MKEIKEYIFLLFIPVFYIFGVFAVVYLSRIFAIYYYFGIGHIDFVKEYTKAGEIGVKIGGVIAFITCACIIFDKSKKERL